MPKPDKTKPFSDARKVTLEMVAERSGVSPSTVSRILNGTAVVSDDKRAAVEQAIEQLGFVPNPVARGLAGGRSWSVGVVTQTIDSPFFGTALRGIEDELDRTGYIALFVSGHWNTEEELRCIDALRSRRADGIIVMSGRIGDTALRACAKSVPVVVTGRSLKAPNLFSLNFDNVTGARLATEHLLQLGHRRIAFITGVPGHADAVEREQGFRQGLAAAGITPDENLIVPGQFHEESGRLAMEQLLLGRHRFSAVLAANDQMAFGAALALHQRGMQVPQDVSLVGFDDLAPSTYTLPPLTTVHQPGYELGRLAAAAMLQLLAGSKPTIEMPPPRLVARESTARPRR